MSTLYGGSVHFILYGDSVDTRQCPLYFVGVGEHRKWSSVARDYTVFGGEGGTRNCSGHRGWCEWVFCRHISGLVRVDEDIHVEKEYIFLWIFDSDIHYPCREGVHLLMDIR